MTTQRLLDKLKNLTVAPTTVFLDQFAHGQCRCELTANDQLAAVYREIALEFPDSPALSTDQIKRLGESLGQRLQYLMEPIAPIELDADGATLQMRSVPPAQEGDARSYYELLVRPQRLELCRYVSTQDEPRSRSTMTITHEVFGRLMSDFAAAHADLI